MISPLSIRDQAMVMVIEGDQVVAAGLADALTHAGYAARCCSDAEAALVAVELAQPNLIIADVNLRGVGGLQLCDRIRQRDGLAGVPVMFLSAMQTPDIIRRAYANGAAYFLRKPFDFDVLLELVESSLLPSVVAYGPCGPITAESVVSCTAEILCGGAAS